ncbi:ABC transporter [[Bacillus] sp. KCTC 13219]|uniref:ABC transporter permease n=1 Tax=Metasolibacillus fluoroglycofenilyticus TaxID=1239396 RepID=UPI0007992E11|nr:ABC transporter permease subunit [Metasolibacillus fluoroglycofenilyticus]KYG91969.1 ABC transporter [[Bacillus] sp. KCTC 13219]
MLKLIQNEWMKLWHQKATWTMLGILVAVIVGAGALNKYYEEPDTRDWHAVEKENIETSKQILAEEDNAANTYWQDAIAISEYRLAHDIAPPTGMTVASFMDFGVQLISIVTLFTVIVGASIVSSEFSTGTIKMLLTRPVTRAKILTSKLIATFVYGLFMLAVNFALAWIVALILYSGNTGTVLEVVNGQVQEVDVWKNIIELSTLSAGNFIMSILFAFLIGSVFRSSALAIGLTMFLTFMGGAIIMVISRYSFTKYVWLAHTDLTQYYGEGQHMIAGVTMPFSLAVLAIYAIIFLVISYWSFTKRDVTA